MKGHFTTTATEECTDDVWVALRNMFNVVCMNIVLRSNPLLLLCKVHDIPDAVHEQSMHIIIHKTRWFQQGDKQSWLIIRNCNNTLLLQYMCFYKDMARAAN